VTLARCSVSERTGALFARPDTMTTAEIPLGILTAIVGAPFFAYLLRRGTGWS